jgi:hypothetical protein
MMLEHVLEAAAVVLEWMENCSCDVMPTAMAELVEFLVPECAQVSIAAVALEELAAIVWTWHWRMRCNNNGWSILSSNTRERES